MILVELALKVIYRQFVTTFEATVVLRVLLHCIVRQMNVPAVEVADVERFARSPEVAVAVHVPFQHAIDRSQHGKGSDVKLATVYEKRSVNVLLHD